MAVTFAIVVAVVAAAGLPMLMEYTYPPGEVVTEVLEASAPGEVGAVADRFANGSGVDALGKEPRGDGHVPPVNVRLVDVAKADRDSTTVTVSYDLGKQTRTELVKVTRDGLFAPWRIDATPPILSIDLVWPVPVRVAEVPAEPGPVAVAPGSYRVEVDDDLFTTAATTAVVGLDGGVVELDPRLSKKSIGIATAGINEVIDECADSKEPLGLQSGCPFFETRPRVPEPESVSWKVTDYPEIDLETNDGELVVDTTKRGEAIVTMSYEGRAAKAYTCGFNVDGSLEISGDALDWTGSPASNLEGCDRS